MIKYLSQMFHNLVSTVEFLPSRKLASSHGKEPNQAKKQLKCREYNKCRGWQRSKRWD
jgi:hypothetical protein